MGYEDIMRREEARSGCCTMTPTGLLQLKLGAPRAAGPQTKGRKQGPAGTDQAQLLLQGQGLSAQGSPKGARA